MCTDYGLFHPFSFRRISTPSPTHRITDTFASTFAWQNIEILIENDFNYSFIASARFTCFTLRRIGLCIFLRPPPKIKIESLIFSFRLHQVGSEEFRKRHNVYGWRLRKRNSLKVPIRLLAFDKNHALREIIARAPRNDICCQHKLACFVCALINSNAAEHFSDGNGNRVVNLLHEKCNRNN